MSLIGPRPEQPAFVRDFDRKLPFYIYRHVVKPGITGWAQVRQGYAASIGQTREKIAYDFYYIMHCSLYLDAFILFLTVNALFTVSAACLLPGGTLGQKWARLPERINNVRER